MIEDWVLAATIRHGQQNLRLGQDSSACAKGKRIRGDDLLRNLLFCLRFLRAF
jgi:hypothetical protein